jgi:hypothetical protein
MQGLFGKRTVIIENPGLVASPLCERLPLSARKATNLDDLRIGQFGKVASRGKPLRRPDMAIV